MREIHEISPNDIEKLCNELYYIYIEYKKRSEEKKEKERYARIMQQYLISSENIHAILTHILSFQLSNCIFLEPSCGDGRMINALVTQEMIPYVIGCVILIQLFERKQLNHLKHTQISVAFISVIFYKQLEKLFLLLIYLHSSQSILISF